MRRSVFKGYFHSFQAWLHFDGLDIGKHIQPKESHHPYEAHSQPGRHKHEVHELHGKPEDTVKQKGSDTFLLKFKPSILALLALQPCHAHVEDDHHPGGEDELVQEQLLGDDGTRGAWEFSIKPRVPSGQKWREDKCAHYGVALHTRHVQTMGGQAAC